MQSSRIEQEIDDIFEFVESCRMQRLSSTKVVVPKDELYDLLDDLRRDVPEWKATGHHFSFLVC